MNFRRITLASALLALSATSAGAQTDYYNTDRNRPTRVEDAHATELYAVEVKMAPLRIDQVEGGLSRWTFHPEAAYGVFPRTSIEVGLPVVTSADEALAFPGLELSAFHNLNVETLSLPAMAIRADLGVPFDRADGSALFPAITGIVSRTFSAGRVHLNGQYTFGDFPTAADEHDDDSGRWLAGAAVDRVFPLRALLLIAEVYAIGSPEADSAVRWTAGAGVRYQVNPFLALDAGLGRSFDPGAGWHATLGSALHIGVPALVRGGGR